MNGLIVTYQLINPTSNREKLIQKIKAYPSVRIGNSSYLIYTDLSPVDVRDYLKKALFRGDKLYVGMIEAPAAWTGFSDEASNWIRKYLKQHY